MTHTTKESAKTKTTVPPTVVEDKVTLSALRAKAKSLKVKGWYRIYNKEQLESMIANHKG